jgi:hypothetical protein
LLIDTDRDWATELGLDTGQPDLLIIDRDGRLITTFREVCKTDLEAQVANQLDGSGEGS